MATLDIRDPAAASEQEEKGKNGLTRGGCVGSQIASPAPPSHPRQKLSRADDPCEAPGPLPPPPSGGYNPPPPSPLLCPLSALVICFSLIGALVLAVCLSVLLSSRKLGQPVVRVQCARAPSTPPPHKEGNTHDQRRPPPSAPPPPHPPPLRH
jgi:hypothetical protein